MSISIRLQRHGSKKRPYYRIVATDSRSPRDGAFKELLGTYDPSRSPVVLDVNSERLNCWVSVGGQLSDTVRTLINEAKLGRVRSSKETIQGNRDRLAESRARALEGASPVVRSPGLPSASAEG